jgi:microcystin-dependent protein
MKKMIKENKAKTTHQTAIVKARHFGINIWFTGLMALCLWVAGASAQASPFDGMAFQSYLVDSNDAAISGNKSLKFSIFDTDSGGTLQWAETQTVTVSNGNFSVILGEGTWDNTAASTREPLGNVFDGSDRYIEIAVDGVTLAPRLRLLPSPYTFRALTADKLSNNDTPILEVNAAGTTATGTLSVTGATSLKDTTADGTLSVTGNTTLSSATASGTITANKFEGHGTTPIGGIIMWSNLNGIPEPSGWAICNGKTKNGITTPDLTGRFIVGGGTADSSIPQNNTVNKNYEINHETKGKGGENEVKLAVNEMPSHTHSGTTNKDGDHVHHANGAYIVGAGDQVWALTWAPENNNPKGKVHSNGSVHKHGFVTNATGGTQAHENRPPYYALAYIMRVE